MLVRPRLRAAWLVCTMIATGAQLLVLVHNYLYWCTITGTGAHLLGRPRLRAEWLVCPLTRKLIATGLLDRTPGCQLPPVSVKIQIQKCSHFILLF